MRLTRRRTRAFGRLALALGLQLLSSASAQTKIACIGDSITEGAGLSSPTLESCPAQAAYPAAACPEGTDPVTRDGEDSSLFYRRDILTLAWQRCRANGGSAGVDGQTFEAIEAGGLGRWLDRLRDQGTS